MHDGLHTCILPAGKLYISSLGLEASPERANPAATENTLTGEEDALNPTRTAIRLDGNARIRPLYNLHDDTIDGVKICHVIPGSFWDELGTEDGDVILELSDHLIDSAAASVELMNQFSRGYVLNPRLQTNEGRERFIEYRTPELPRTDRAGTPCPSRDLRRGRR